MASQGRSAQLRRHVVATTALIKTDLVALTRSWVLRGWFVALVLSEFFWLTIAVAGNRLVPAPASQIVAGVLGAFLLVWSTIIIVISAGSVSLEAEMVSDGILSRACTRAEYIVGKLAARVGVVAGLYALSAGVAGFVAWRYAANDMCLPGLLAGISVVGLAVVMLVTVGIAFSVALNNTIVSVIALLLLWYVAAPVFNAVGAEYLSPTSLIRNLPAMMKDPQAPKVVQCTATPSSITLVFSKNVDRASAERADNYAIESPLGQPQAAASAAYDRSKTSVVLSGLRFIGGETVRVSVRGVTDSGGTPISPAADSAECTAPTVAPAGTAPAPASATPKRVPPAGDRRPPRVLRCSATQSSIQVEFSEELDAETAEDPVNYLVENPLGRSHSPRASTYRAGARSVLLSGLDLDLGSSVKVTVRNVTDRRGNKVATSANSAVYSDISTWKYIAGFGIPTLVACVVAVVWFGRRDL